MRKWLCKWLKRHEWGKYQTVNIQYVLVDKRNLTGRDGDRLKEELSTMRTCTHCDRDEIFSQELGWIKSNG